MKAPERQSPREAGFGDAACLGGRAHHSKPQLGERKCQCTACGELFNGTQSFDRHRIGNFGVDRRCMTAEEMRASGFADNAAGFWMTESRAQRAARHRASGFSAHRAPSARVRVRPSGRARRE